jgi:hypothetical protein
MIAALILTGASVACVVSWIGRCIYRDINGDAS